MLEAFEKSNGRRAPESRLCVSEGRKQRSGQEVAIQDSRVLYRKAVKQAITLLDKWGVEHRPDGRLPGEDLLRQILGERFDEIMGTGEARPTLRVVG